MRPKTRLENQQTYINKFEARVSVELVRFMALKVILTMT